MISLDILQQFICGYWDMKSYALLELKVLGNERLFLCGLNFPPRIESSVWTEHFEVASISDH